MINLRDFDFDKLYDMFYTQKIQARKIMNKALKIINSTPGRKAVMALTGLFFCILLVEHLYTNLLLYKADGGLAFVEVSHNMTHSLLIRFIEIVLFAGLLIHAAQALYLTIENRRARPVKYLISGTDQTSTWFSRNMGLTGSLILAFLIFHLADFFVEYRLTGLGEGRNLATEVKETFSSAGYCAIYVVSVVILGLHLNHALQSVFQTLGVSNKKYAPAIKMAGTGFAIIIACGFASFPVLFYFNLAGKGF